MWDVNSIETRIVEVLSLTETYIQVIRIRGKFCACIMYILLYNIHICSIHSISILQIILLYTCVGMCNVHVYLTYYGHDSASFLAFVNHKNNNCDFYSSLFSHHFLRMGLMSSKRKQTLVKIDQWRFKNNVIQFEICIWIDFHIKYIFESLFWWIY